MAEYNSVESTLAGYYGWVGNNRTKRRALSPEKFKALINAHPGKIGVHGQKGKVWSYTDTGRRPKFSIVNAGAGSSGASKANTNANIAILTSILEKEKAGGKLTKEERAERAQLLNKLSTAGINTARFAPPAATAARAATTRGRKKAATGPTNADVEKSYYLLAVALGNSSNYDPMRFTNNQRKFLVNAARRFRLATKSQLASWAGSFLETNGFNQGAQAKGTVEVVNGQQKNTPSNGVQYGNPKWLIYKDASLRERRTRPTLFLKTAWNMNLIKSEEAMAKARQVFRSTNLPNKMNKLVKFTEDLIKIKNNENANENTANEVLAGKTKGTTQIQPDIILVLPPDGNTPGQIHIYELKIGAGKKETIPAESIQLAKMKFILDVWLGDERPKWDVIPHFLPWRFALRNKTALNFKNWKTTALTGVKAIADAFIKANKYYNINQSTKTAKPLANYLNIPTVNRVLGSSHIGRLNNARTGAGRVVVESIKTQIENQMRANGINGVVHYLKLANTRPRVPHIPTLGDIQRAISRDLEKQIGIYFLNVTNNSIIPNWVPPNLRPRRPGGPEYSLSEISKAKNKNIPREVLQARLARSAAIADTYLEALKNMGKQLPEGLADLVAGVKNLLEKGGIENAGNYNLNTRKILNAVRANSELQANRVYEELLKKFGNSPRNLVSKAILQTFAANQSLNNKTRARAQFLIENFNEGIAKARNRIPRAGR